MSDGVLKRLTGRLKSLALESSAAQGLANFITGLVDKVKKSLG